jgi:UDP-N-acetylglucosamine--N-acetylmuramyl-(pentapeptide) pyrophosphoryl-undecaprenol N-acetylglucosamine transferase
VIRTGNPVRDEIARLRAEPGSRGSAQPRRAQARILVLGGSLGARPINAAIRQILRDDAAWCRRFEWVHQTGPDDLAELTDAYRTAEVTAHVAPFLSDMAEQLPQASLVIARAGATTLAELACAGIPAIVIPYPQATDRHQDLNADAYARVGAARVVAQASPGTTLAARLFAGLRDLFDHPHEIESMRAAMRRQARPDAAQCVVDVIAHLCGPGNDPE